MRRAPRKAARLASASSVRDVSPQAPSTSSVLDLRSNRGSMRPTSRSPHEDRQDVVAVFALRLRHVHLEAVAEVEERLRAVAVVDETVEGGEERDAIGDGRVRRVRMRLPALLRQPHALRAETLLREHTVGLARRHRLDRRIPALGEIPQSLLSLPPGDRDDAVRLEDLEHQRHLAAPPPAVGLVRSGRRLVLELAREHRPVALELAQDVALEARVRLQELGAPTLVRVLPTPPATPHARLHERQRLDRPDVRVPLEQLPVDPEQAVELGDVVRPEPAPEDELLRRRDRRDGIDLQEAEPANRVEDRRRRAVEELRANCDPARLLRRDEPHRGSASRSSRQRTPASSFDSGAVSLRAERASSQFA